MILKGKGNCVRSPAFKGKVPEAVHDIRSGFESLNVPSESLFVHLFRHVLSIYPNDRFWSVMRHR